MTGNGELKGRKGSLERRALGQLLAINAVMFIFEIAAGLASESTALIADSLDMLGDAGIYAISLYAVGKSAELKAEAAGLSGLLQISLGLFVLFDIIRRILFGSEPEPLWMVGVGVAAFAANFACLRIIAAHRHGEVHMRAAWIFSKNDVLANLGVIAGGLLVAASGTAWPDLAIGLLIVALIIRGGVRIVIDAAAERHSPTRG